MASVDDLWLVDFGDRTEPGEPALRRPALVLGPPETFGPAFPFTIVAPLTTRARGLSLHVEVEPTPLNGLDETSYVQCELMRSINSSRLTHRLGAVDPTTSWAVEDVVRTLLAY